LGNYYDHFAKETAFGEPVAKPTSIVGLFFLISILRNDICKIANALTQFTYSDIYHLEIFYESSIRRQQWNNKMKMIFILKHFCLQFRK